MKLSEVLIIVNPISGKLTSEKYLPSVTGVFEANGVKYKVMRTGKRFDAMNFTSENAYGYDAVVAIGGDGTLNEVISGIASSGIKIPIGYIPSGTTNDYAKSIGIPVDPELGARAIINGSPKAFDLGKFNDRYFTYIASFGAFTSTSYATSQDIKNKLGHSAYVLGSVKELFTKKHFHVKAIADGKTYEGFFMFGAVCNTYSIGGVFNLNPEEVDMSDGKYEIVLAKEAKDPVSLLKTVIDFNNHKYPSDSIQFFKADKIRFISDDALDWSLDGEHAFGGTDVTVTNIPAGISLILDNH